MVEKVPSENRQPDPWFVEVHLEQAYRHRLQTLVRTELQGRSICRTKDRPVAIAFETPVCWKTSRLMAGGGYHRVSDLSVRARNDDH